MDDWCDKVNQHIKSRTTTTKFFPHNFSSIHDFGNTTQMASANQEITASVADFEFFDEEKGRIYHH
jgi:hypothetical protein